ncbi:glycosyltransferase [Conexibacter woesei]|uniref:Glycosyltransferase, MGT family n=1 Tax=Conexibacter woesei (strain DSM 14684 / CCUG 47730 / CIP 108061 / JCM 11494 / NBRC 100937 / ID131577) TaxID=469383 RepID=D3F9R8_CONWI|nr:glycosyltransferase [Conexibacter woesei]ADB51130.1 glycosyltransferase, MGT family [Conexibacter woesei DSM 14684]
MRALLASTAGAGHVGPLLPFAAALARRGDDVLVVGPPGLEPAIAAAGHAFAAGADPPAQEVAEIWRRFESAPPPERSVLVNRELFGRLCTAAMLPALDRVCDEWRPDLVLREPCDFASAIAAERRAIPHAQVAISLAEVEAGSLALAAPVLDPHLPGIVERIHAAPYLTRFPRALDPSPFARTVRFRAGGAADRAGGEGAAESAGGPSAADGWRQAWPEDDERPLVYATLGSVAPTLALAAPVYRAIVDAVAELPVRVLLTVGRQPDPDTLGPLPPNVRAAAWVDQAGVLPGAAVVVCHGGSGTTFGALAAGVPLVLLPLFADQPVNARRVVEAGAGIAVAPPHAADDVRAAIEQLLSTPAHRDAAGAIAREMCAAPSVTDVLDQLV